MRISARWTDGAEEEDAWLGLLIRGTVVDGVLLECDQMTRVHDFTSVVVLVPAPCAIACVIRVVVEDGAVTVTVIILFNLLVNSMWTELTGNDG